MRLLCLSYEFELLILIRVRVDLDARQLGSLHQVDHQVEERDQVVPAAGVVELQLVQTSEDQVASEDIDLFFIDVLFGHLVNVSRCETEINQIYRVTHKNVVISFAKVGVAVNSVVQEEIVELQVVVDVACFVDFLEHVD